MFSLASSLPSQTSANIFKESLQPLTEGHRISLGILYAPVCFGQSSQFPASVLLNLLQARRRSEPLALLHYACKQRCGSFVAFALAGDNVAAEVVAGSAKPKNLFPPGMGGFFFAEFRAIGRPLGGLDVHEFVHAAEGGGVFGGGERGAHPKRIDGCTPDKQVSNGEFVQISAGDDSRVVQPCLIQPNTHLFGKLQ